MISNFQCGETGQTLSILDYDGNRTRNVRYKAVVNDYQVAVLNLQTVDTNHTQHHVSQLSLCPGVLESDVVLSSSSLTKFLIEKVEDDIFYRLVDFFGCS